VAELENTYAALEDGLHRIEFFKSRTPESILRTLRTVISRAEPDLQEAGLLRAIGFEIGHYLDRKLGSLVEAPEEGGASEVDEDTQGRDGAGH
jgi:tRNA C32,U32 (ribose-2'-O)-methylase TrmJ